MTLIIVATVANNFPVWPSHNIVAVYCLYSVFAAGDEGQRAEVRGGHRGRHPEEAHLLPLHPHHDGVLRGGHLQSTCDVYYLIICHEGINESCIITEHLAGSDLFNTIAHRSFELSEDKCKIIRESFHRASQLLVDESTNYTFTNIHNHTQDLLNSPQWPDTRGPEFHAREEDSPHGHQTQQHHVQPQRPLKPPRQDH